MKKCVMAVCVLCAAAMLLAGCRYQERHPKMEVNVVDDKVVYDGTEQYFYEVETGTVGTLKVKVLKYDGELALKVFATEDRSQVAYKGNDIPTSDFEVILSEPGKYKVWVEAKKFKGSYGFDFSLAPKAE